MAKERDVIKILFTTFINSLRPRKFSGTLIGKDYLGNSYYEIQKNATSAKQRQSRWFVPQMKEKFDQELPAEWDSWLRYRRREPPTEEEVLANKSIADLKKINAQKLDKEYGLPEPKPTQLSKFPTYEDYEIQPGTSPKKS